MKPVSTDVGERSRKAHSLVLQRMASVGQVRVAEDLSTSESTISRFVNADLERTCLIFAALGLKVVPQTHICVAKPMYDALVTIAAGAMKDPETIQKLVWED